MKHACTRTLTVLAMLALCTVTVRSAAAQDTLAPLTIAQSRGASGSSTTSRSRDTVNALATRWVTLTLDGASLDEALSEIARISGVPIMYGEDVLRSRTRVSLRLRHATLADAVEKALEGSGLTAKLAPGGQALLVQKAEKSRPTAADTVTGTVTDEVSGRGLAGVQVSVDDRLRTVTDTLGRFRVADLAAGEHTILIRMLGYAPVTRAFTLRSGEPLELDFAMKLQPLALDAVVVTGVSDPTSSRNLPFSVGKISGDAVRSVPASPGNAIGALTGKVAGVTVLRGSGDPSSSPEILLRTPTSIQNTISNNPMIVVDGVILSSTNTTGALDIDALDIESIEVVKGAAAAALYGSRAASGVVQIRTRRGADLAEGETRITARSEIGLNQAPIDYPLATHHFYVTNAEGQFLDASGNVTTDPSERVVETDGIMDNAYGVPLYDNVKSLFQPGRFMTNSITVRQNSGATNYLATLEQSTQQGALANNDGTKDYSLRLNLDHHIGDDFSVGITALHSRMNVDYLYNSPFATLLEYPSEVDLGRKDSTGQYMRYPDPNVATENPLWYQGTHFNDGRRARTLGGLQASYQPASWLGFSGNFSYDRLDSKNQRYIPMGTPQGSGSNSGYLQDNSSVVEAMNASGTASLSGDVGDLATRLNLTALMERERNDFFNATGQDFRVGGVKNLGAAQTVFGSSTFQEIRANGYYADLNLNFRGRYIADLLLRRDGSSLFGVDERWQTYYRTAFAYRLSDEPWFHIPGVSDLKLRFSQGTAGGRPAFSAHYESWEVWSGGIDKTILGNRDLRPSLTTEREYGIDLGIRNRLSLQLTYAKQETEGQIISMTVPAVTGYSTRWMNAGTLDGHTLEATLEAVLVDRPGFRWTSSLVADRSRSEITEWPKACYVSLLQKFCAGSSLSDIWGQQFITSADQLPAGASPDEFQVNDDGYLVWVGAGNSWKDGLAKNLWGASGTVNGVSYDWGMPILLLDSTGAPAVVKIGTSRPDLNFGWGNSVQWKDFSFYAQIRGQIGGRIYNRARQSLYVDRRHGDLDQAGKSPETKKPFTYYTGLANGGFRITKNFLEDGTYLRLGELSAQYTLDADHLARLGLGRLGLHDIRLGLIGRNLFTITDYTGFDPEVGNILWRYDSAVYPNLRTFTGTIAITF